MKEKLLILILFLFTTGMVAQSTGSDEFSYTIDTIIMPSCYGQSNGSIIMKEITIPGTIKKYEWSNGSQDKDLRHSKSGRYQLIVYDTEGNVYRTKFILLPQPDSLVIDAFLSNPMATGKKDGFIDLTMNGGTPPYSLAVVTQQDTTIVEIDSNYFLSGVDTGYYKFYVADVRGCIDSAIINVRPLSCQLLVTARVTPAECDAAPSGSINLYLDNAPPPVSIKWSNGVKDRTSISKLAAGTYHFTVEDRRGCTVSDSFVVINQDLVPPDVFVKNKLSLYLDSGGKATLTMKDFFIRAEDKCHNDLTFQLDQSEFTCDHVGANEVKFHVTDGVGNTNTTTIDVEIRDTHSVQLIYQDTVYTALCNGIAQYQSPVVRGICSKNSSVGVVKSTKREINAPGKYTDHYYYVVKPGDTLKAKVTVFVEDRNVRAFLLVEEPDCNMGNDGSVVVSTRNAREPVRYLWNNGSEEDFVFGIRNQNKYSVTVQEGSGCVFQLSTYIEGPDSLRVKLAEIKERDGSIHIITEVTGGHPPLSYVWRSDGIEYRQTKNLIDVPDGHFYTLEVIDAKNCRSHILTVDRTMTPADDDLSSSIVIFPNPGSPSHSSVQIHLGDHFQKYQQIHLLNNRQETLKSIYKIDPQNHLSVTGLPAGIYFLQFITKEGRIFTKKYLKL